MGLIKELDYPQIKGIFHFYFTTPPELNSWVLPFSNPFSRFSHI